MVAIKLNLTMIRVEMAKQNLNQKKLAHKANIQEPTICLIMNGKSRGSIETWGKIAAALGVDVTEIIEGNPK